MARTGLTFDEVVIAANELHTQGQNPTIEKIRQKIGSGSNSTIAKYLNAWREQHGVLREVETKVSPPDIVKLAAEQAWLEIRKDTDQQIAAMQAETKALQLDAEQKVKQAEENEAALHEALQQLKEQYHADLAQKELLTLDLKKLQQAHDLLIERNTNLTERLKENQIMTGQQLAYAKEAHDKEITRLSEQLNLQKQSEQKLIDELKTQFEDSRHQAMLALDNAKEENKKLAKQISAYQDACKQKELENTKMQATLAATLKERTETLAIFAEQSKAWQTLKDKSLISTDVLSQIAAWPKAKDLFAQLQQQFSISFSQVQEILKEQTEALKAINMQDVEAEDA